MDDSLERVKARILRRWFISVVALLALTALIVIINLFFPAHLGSFLMSFIAGCVGGSITLLKRIKQEEEAVLRRLAGSWIAALLPMLYGGVMAAIAYLLFMSEVLSGEGGEGLFRSNLFPNFRLPDVGDELLTIKHVLAIRPESINDWGKLIVWCFIAGYSEKFVSDVLDSLLKKETGQAPVN